MIENLVDVWLTEASERSYEAAFGQLLVIEGYRVIQGPMHHAHEHGKDIIAWDPEGDLCVYQLKGGKGSLDLAAVEKAQDQLLAAAASAVMHPSLPDLRRPDRVYLVTNQTATGPAQGRIRALSEGNRSSGLAPLQMIERAELTSQFVAAEGQFFPSSPKALNTFLTLFLADGRGELPRRDFFRLLEEILPVSGPRARASDAGRAISAAALTTAFAPAQVGRSREPRGDCDRLELLRDAGTQAGGKESSWSVTLGEILSVGTGGGSSSCQASAR